MGSKEWSRKKCLVVGFYVRSSLGQRSPTFLAPGTCFMEDSFSTDGGKGDGFRMIQAYYIYCVLLISIIITL